MTNMQKKQKTGLMNYADRFLLIGVTIFFCFFLLVVYRADRRDIEKLADETIDFLETVCQRYDGYAEGQKAARLKDVQDKAVGLSKLVLSERIENADYLMEFAKVQELTGVLVTDGQLRLVAQADVEGNDAYFLWKDFINEDNKRNIIENEKKIYSGNVTKDGTDYDVVIVARKDAEGIILCYSRSEAPVTDIYEATLEKTLTNNTFHKNPKIVISDGDNVIASNAVMKSNKDGGLIKAQDEKYWKKGRLIQVKVDGTIWYGKRQVYEKYYIYIFYPSSEVFDNMLPILAIGIAICAVLGLILTIVKHNSEKKYMNEERKQLETIQAISSLYVTTSVFHLKEKRIEGLKSTDRAQQVLDETTQAESAVKKLADRIIAPEYRKKYVSFLDISTMEERLEHNENLTEVFKDVNGVWFSACCGQAFL